VPNEYCQESDHGTEDDRSERRFNTVGHHLVARPVRSGERDLLHGNELQTLYFKTGGQVLHCVPAPAGGWTHEALQSVAQPADCWDAYLGDEWVGSSEI